MDAFTALEADHRRAESLLTALRTAPRSERTATLAQLNRLVGDYAAAEQSIVFPELRRGDAVVPETGQSERALSRLQGRFADLLQMSPDTPAWEAAFHDLDVALREHFRREGSELFPAARKALPPETLQRLGTRLAEQRAAAAPVGEAGIAPGPATTASAVSRAARDSEPAAPASTTRPAPTPAEAWAAAMPEARAGPSDGADRMLDRALATARSHPAMVFGSALLAGAALTGLIRWTVRRQAAPHRVVAH